MHERRDTGRRFLDPRPVNTQRSVAGGERAFQVHVEGEERDEEGQDADQPRVRVPPAAERPPPPESDERGDDSPDDARLEAAGLTRQAFREAGLLRGGLGFVGFALLAGASFALITMRCAAEPLGLHAVSVSSGPGVLSTTHTSVGLTMSWAYIW